MPDRKRQLRPEDELLTRQQRKAWDRFEAMPEEDYGVIEYMLRHKDATCAELMKKFKLKPGQLQAVIDLTLIKYGTL